MVSHILFSCLGQCLEILLIKKNVRVFLLHKIFMNIRHATLECLYWSRVKKLF